MPDVAAAALKLLSERQSALSGGSSVSSAAADPPLSAVVYFDSARGFGGEWVVRTHDGGCWSLKSAPVHERDAFVIFDEAHCRGADMKMRRGLGVLTLGPRMCKDKEMQVGLKHHPRLAERRGP